MIDRTVRRVPGHRHVWVFAHIPGCLAFRCGICRALVEVVVDQLPNTNVRFRFRCLAGTDKLVSDREFAELADWLGMFSVEHVYAGRPRRPDPPSARARRRRRKRC